MYKITKKFKFEYAHRLDLDYDSPCSNIHGHSAKVYVSLTANSLDKNGMIIDFKELLFIDEFLQENYDHRMLLSNKNVSTVMYHRNSKLFILDKNPTAENIAYDITQSIIKKIKDNNKFKNITSVKVTVYETENNSATYKQKLKEEEKEKENYKDKSDCCKCDLYLSLTDEGQNQLTYLLAELNSGIDDDDISITELMICRLLELCCETTVIIPQGEIIDIIMEYINDQYFNYSGGETEFQITPNHLYRCLSDGYLTISIVKWSE